MVVVGGCYNEIHARVTLPRSEDKSTVEYTADESLATSKSAAAAAGALPIAESGEVVSLWPGEFSTPTRKLRRRVRSPPWSAVAMFNHIHSDIEF